MPEMPTMPSLEEMIADIEALVRFERANPANLELCDREKNHKWDRVIFTCAELVELMTRTYGCDFAATYAEPIVRLLQRAFVSGYLLAYEE